MRKHVTILRTCARGARSYTSKPHPRLWAAEDFGQRLDSVERLYKHEGLETRRYPRISGDVIDASQYLDTLKKGNVDISKEYQVVGKEHCRPRSMLMTAGRVAKLRMLGSKLIFIELETAGKRIQVECNFKAITQDGSDRQAWNSFRKNVHIGDHWSE
jgi:lysyl-tRNA synthetase class II